ncbi:hypothetical protein JW916_08160 [Candidatus Sumerlaeota bacterium]|nr:hypothetical protein [Candidatus Sumerlaeota bacterium]
MEFDHHVPLDRIHHPRYVRDLLVLACVYAAGFLFLFEPWPGGGYDQVVCFSRMPSLVEDGDVELSNDFLRAYNSLAVTETAVRSLTDEGYLADSLPVGSSLLDAPFWLLAYGIDVGFLKPTEQNPCSWVYRFAVSFSSAFYGFLGLVLCWRTGCRFVSSHLAVSGAAFTFFSSAVLIWAFQKPVYPYAHAFFATALFLFVAVDHVPYGTLRAALYLGASAGLMFITSCSSAPFLFLPIVLTIWPHSVDPFWSHDRRRRRARNATRRRRKRAAGNAQVKGDDADAESVDRGRDAPIAAEPKKAPRSAIALRVVSCVLFAGVGFSVCASPQFVVWRKVFGSWIATPDSGERFSRFTDFLALVGVSWWESFLGDRAGLFQWHPFLVVSLVGLLLMALRRHALGVSLLACIVLVFAIGSIFTLGRANDLDAGPGHPALLVPCFSIGTTYFLYRLRSSFLRVGSEIVLAVGVLWNVVVLISLKRGLVEISPLVGTRDTWLVVLREALAHPLSFFSDSLLLRYLQQGTPPLEPLLVLLLMVLLFPLAMLGGLRYAVPAVRKLRLTAFVGLAALFVSGGFDYLVWRSESESARANRAFRAAIRDTASSIPSPPERSEAIAYRVQDIVSSHPRGDGPALSVARIRIGQGRIDEALAIYDGLAFDSFYAGRLGLFDAARDPIEKQTARDRLAAGETADLDTLVRIAESFMDTGQIERARDWLDRTYPPSHVYWLLRARMAEGDSGLHLAFLRRALVFDPTSPVILEKAWFELHEQRRDSEAGALLRRLQAVGDEQILLRQDALRRRSGEETRRDLAEAGRYVLARARIHEALGRTRQAALEWSRYALLSDDPATQNWALERMRPALSGKSGTSPAASEAVRALLDASTTGTIRTEDIAATTVERAATESGTTDGFTTESLTTPSINSLPAAFDVPSTSSAETARERQ